MDEPLLMINYNPNNGNEESRVWAHANRIGSVVATTDENGGDVERYKYSPYGVSGDEGDTGFPFRFTGQKIYADAGLYHYKARWYDPEVGRFLQTDPIGYEDQQNMYAYAMNDPLNGTDPDGQVVRAVVSAYKIAKRTVKARGNVIKAIKDEVVSIGDAAVTIADPNASGFDKISAVVEVAIGVGLPGKGSPCCFVAGTLVETKDGLRPIEEIEIGDLVWAHDPLTEETTLKPVTDVIPSHQREIWEVSLVGSGGETEHFETTEEHPWWVVGRGWLETQQLNAGMAVTTKDGNGMVITSVGKTSRTDATFNLTVADFETYFVGKQKILVHNCGGNKPPNLSPEGAGRNGAFNQAKRDNNIPTSQQPDRTGSNVDRRGNTQDGRQYKFTNSEGEKVTIRDDAGGHKFDDDPSQDRGSHFNDDQGRHYDYPDK